MIGKRLHQPKKLFVIADYMIESREIVDESIESQKERIDIVLGFPFETVELFEVSQPLREWNSSILVLEMFPQLLNLVGGIRSGDRFVSRSERANEYVVTLVSLLTSLSVVEMQPSLRLLVGSAEQLFGAEVGFHLELPEDEVLRFETGEGVAVVFRHP